MASSGQRPREGASGARGAGGFSSSEALEFVNRLEQLVIMNGKALVDAEQRFA